MANRYWVGGSGNWDASTTTHWSATSGGASGASVPASTDAVFFDSLSNATGYTVTITADANPLSIDMEAPASGSVTLTLQANLTLSGSAYSLYQNNGTLNVGAYNITGNDVFFQANTSLYGSAPVVNMGSGTWTITGNDSNAGSFPFGTENDVGSVTINAQTSTIKFTDATTNTKTFSSNNGEVYNNIWFSGSGTGTFILSASNTFNDFKDTGTSAHTIQFLHGTTTTVNTFTVSGTAGKLISISSDTAATHSLVKLGGGNISSDYLSIQYSAVVPANTWYAGANSTNGGNNSGWIFHPPFASQTKSTAPVFVNANQSSSSVFTDAPQSTAPVFTTTNQSSSLVFTNAPRSTAPVFVNSNQS